MSRLCLKCGQYFPSKSVGNRICPKCAHVNAQTSGVKTIVSDRARYGHPGPIESHSSVAEREHRCVV